MAGINEYVIEVNRVQFARKFLELLFEGSLWFCDLSKCLEFTSSEYSNVKSSSGLNTGQ